MASLQTKAVKYWGKTATLGYSATYEYYGHVRGKNTHIVNLRLTCSIEDQYGFMGNNADILHRKTQTLKLYHKISDQNIRRKKSYLVLFKPQYLDMF